MAAQGNGRNDRSRARKTARACQETGGGDDRPMPASDSAPVAIEPEAIAYARGLLKAPLPKDQTWAAIGAGALLAVASLALAFAMLTAPAPGSSGPKARVDIPAG
jgi:hypothetical protein